MTASLTGLNLGIGDTVTGYSLEFSYIGPASPCIIDIACSETDNFEGQRSTYNATFDPVSEELLFDASVQYDCGTARGFYKSDGTSVPTQTFTCGWDGVWSPGPIDVATCNCTLAYIRLQSLKVCE